MINPARKIETIKCVFVLKRHQEMILVILLQGAGIAKNLRRVFTIVDERLRQMCFLSLPFVFVERALHCPTPDRTLMFLQELFVGLD